MLSGLSGLTEPLMSGNLADDREDTSAAPHRLDFAFCGLDSSVGTDVWARVLAPIEGKGGTVARLVGAFQLAYQGFPSCPTKEYAPGSRREGRRYGGLTYPSWEEIRNIKNALPADTPFSFHLNETSECPYVSRLLSGDREMKGFIQELVRNWGARHVQVNLTARGVPTDFFDLTNTEKARRAAEVILALCREHPETAFVVPISDMVREDKTKISTLPFFELLTGLDEGVKNLCGFFDSSAGTGKQPDKAPPVPECYRKRLRYLGCTGGIDADNVKSWLDIYAGSAGDGGHVLISDAQSSFRQMGANGRRERGNPIDEHALDALSQAVRAWAAAEASLSDFPQEHRKLLRAVRHPGRKEVRVSGTIHDASNSPDEGVAQVNLSLKFEYKQDLVRGVFWKQVPTDWDCDERSDPPLREERGGGTVIATKTRQGEMYSIAPYMITNAVETNQIGWYCEKIIKRGADGRETIWLSERLSLCVKVATVSYQKYFPFELNILALKVQMDGTANSALVNLRPAGGGIRCGMLRRETSPFRIYDPEKPVSLVQRLADCVDRRLMDWLGVDEAKEDEFCRMYARDARPTAERRRGGPPKVETTMIASWILEESSKWENAFKYVGVSTFMFFLCTIMSFMDLGDLAQTGLAMVLADVGLLYVLPPNDDFTPTEIIIVVQLMGLLGLTLIESWASYKNDPAETVKEAFERWECHLSIATALAIIFFSGWVLFSAYKWSHDLRARIKGHLGSGRRDAEEDIGLFATLAKDF